MFDFFRKHTLVFVVLLALVVRIMFALLFPVSDQSGGDFVLYQRIADNILAEGNFGGEPQKTYGSPSISPGWSFFLVGYEFLFGKSVPSLLGASITLGVLLSVGVYMLARQFFDRRTAFIAGILTALWPVFIIQTVSYGSSLLLYSTLLVWGIFFLLKSFRGHTLWYAVPAGLLLGFAALVDAIGLFIPMLLVILLFIQERSQRVVLLSLIFLVATALVIAPWTYRNAVVVQQVENQSEVPIIAKDELKQLTPSQLSLMARLLSERSVLVSGLSKLYLFPFDVSVIDQGSVSYRDIILGEDMKLSGEQKVVLIAKGGITILHWVLLLSATVALVMLWRKKMRILPLLVLFLVGYVTIAVLGFGSLSQDDFQGISAPNSFLFPLIPFLIVLTSFLGERVLGRRTLVAQWRNAASYCDSKS